MAVRGKDPLFETVEKMKLAGKELKEFWPEIKAALYQKMLR